MSLADHLNTLEARRRRLRNPPNAVPDRPLEMRNGWPVMPTPPTPIPEVHKPDPWREFYETAHRFVSYATGDTEPTISPIGVNQILHAVSIYYDIRVTDIISARRTYEIVVPRQVTAWLSKELTTFSFPQIGRKLGGRDHTTILHSFRRIEMLRQQDPDLQHDLDQLLSALRPLQENRDAGPITHPSEV